MLPISKISVILKLILISVVILLIPEYENIFLNTVIFLLALVLVLLLSINLIKDVYSIIGLQNNGLNLGIIVSLIVSIETVLLAHSFQIVEDTDMVLAIDLITIVLSTFAIFMSGFKNVPTLHREQLTFMNKILAGKELSEGPSWWFPFVGDRNLFLLENKQLTIFKKVKEISISDSVHFKIMSMHIMYKYLKGSLYKVMNLGENTEEEIKKFSLPYIKKAMLLTITAKTKGCIEQNDSGLSVMDFFLKNTELINRILLNGSFFESHQRYSSLLQDNFYIDSVVKLYNKQHLDKKNVPKSRKLSWFTPEIALEYKLPVFTDEQADNLISNNIGTSELVNNGLLNKFHENGFQFIYFIIGPMKVSENNEYNGNSATNPAPSSSNNRFSEICREIFAWIEIRMIMFIVIIVGRIWYFFNEEDTDFSSSSN